MKIKKRRIIKIVCFSIIAVAVVGFAANWYLKDRLEAFLRQELKERISAATDGFYQFHSDHLSIGLFNGELILQGIELKPDTTVFKQWAAKDSLPRNYFDVKIEKIHFKGLNLIWLFNYKELYFDLFEIETPVVKVLESLNSSRVEVKTRNTDSKTLYEMISPYIDVVSVKKMNLENASITYMTDDEGMPAVYQLKNVSFHAYGFLLDHNSDESGKLLYFDNFDFTTNEPQVLLSNKQFLLETDSIRLSTADSIIRIDNVHLKPQILFWEEQHSAPDTYLESKVDSVLVKGVHFKRENALNYLQARSFSIYDSEIDYFNVKQDTVKKEKSKKEPETKDTLNLSWTLYAIVSPLLHSISIDKIAIEDARLKYINSSPEATDIYNLDRFNFEAFGFKVDSLAEVEQRFLYSKGFWVDASDIQAVVESQNHGVSIGRMRLNTIEKEFRIDNVKLSPLRFNTQRDYMVGSIDSLQLLEWEYDKGLKARQLTVDAPRIEYVKMSKQKEKVSDVNDKSAEVDMVLPYFNHVTISQINLNNGNITFQDKTNKENIIYKLPRIDFYASNFLLNETTVKESRTFFACDNLRFSFQRFDNLLPGKDYRLIINKGVFTGIKGNLELHGVKLVPQKDTWKKAPDTYFAVQAPFIAVKHLDYKTSVTQNTFLLNSLNIESPHIQITKARNSSATEPKESSPKNNPLQFIAGLLDVSNAKIEYVDHTTKDSLGISAGKLQLKALSGDAQMKNTRIGEITLQTPVVSYIKKEDRERQNKASTSKSFSGSLDIGKIGIFDIRLGIDQPNLKLHLETGNLDIRNIQWGNNKFDLASVDIAKPVIKVNQISTTDTVVNKGKEQAKNQDMYQVFDKLASEISVNRLNIDAANIDYASTLDGKLNKQQHLNTTSLSLSGLAVNSGLKTILLDDFDFNTRNFNLPINNGFYTIQVEAIDLKKKQGSLKVQNLHLVPAYPKMVFAYKSPTHRDWFDVEVGDVSLSGIDFDRYFSDNVFYAKELSVKDVVLLNFKNQQIEIQHNIMPMIYEKLQKFPVPFAIDTANVDNFKVVYQELTKKGTTPGEIFFTNMNGRISGLTNIVSRPRQYINLNADGKLMGTGYFTATWMLPVDSLNDHFYLKADMKRFELTDLNRLIIPMATAKVETGEVKSLRFSTNASSEGASVEMLMLYNDLSIAVLKDKDGELTTNSLVSTIANKVIKSNNPDKPDKRPRHAHATIERDAYHSTFNYLWQILQPPVVESIGFSQKKQNFAKKVMGFIHKVKNIFHKEKKKVVEEIEKKEEEHKH